MFKRKSKMMIKATQRKLGLIQSQLDYCSKESNHGVGRNTCPICERLVSQKVILKELLREFFQIEES